MLIFYKDYLFEELIIRNGFFELMITMIPQRKKSFIYTFFDLEIQHSNVKLRFAGYFYT